jgi:hypothetical protein
MAGGLAPCYPAQNVAGKGRFVCDSQQCTRFFANKRITERIPKLCYLHARGATQRSLAKSAHCARIESSALTWLTECGMPSPRSGVGMELVRHVLTRHGGRARHPTDSGCQTKYDRRNGKRGTSRLDAAVHDPDADGDLHGVRGRVRHHWHGVSRTILGLGCDHRTLQLGGNGAGSCSVVWVSMGICASARAAPGVFSNAVVDADRRRNDGS